MLDSKVKHRLKIFKNVLGSIPYTRHKYFDYVLENSVKPKLKRINPNCNCPLELPLWSKKR